MVGLRCSKNGNKSGGDLVSYPVGLENQSDDSKESTVLDNQFVGEEGIGFDGKRTHYTIPRHRVFPGKDTSHLSTEEFLKSRPDKRHGVKKL
ncbi:hypothetical protein KJ603_00255 [Patescibacteria group bacterium]|nr:hypothetical protein [Patescibacteria group bacterium]